MAFTKVVLGLAMTAAIGAGAIGANSLFVAHAFAATNDQKAPVISSETALDTKAGSTATVVADGNGNQAVISDSEQAQIDLKAKMGKNAKPTLVAGTPSEKDLTEKKAVELAKNSIDSKFVLTNATWSKFSTGAVLNVVDPKAPVWCITFYPTNQNDYSQIGTYYVTIDSRSSKIIKIMSAADGVG